MKKDTVLTLESIAAAPYPSLFKYKINVQTDMAWKMEYGDKLFGSFKEYFCFGLPPYFQLNGFKAMLRASARGYGDGEI